MTLTNLFRTEGDTANPTLADAFGLQETHGKPVLIKNEGGQYSFISFLARGECNRAVKVFYGAFLLAEYTPAGVRQWRFHKGTRSTGFDDPEQGRPEFFPELNVAFTEICYIEVRPPAEFGEIDPNKLFVVFEGKVVDDYEIDNVTGDLIVSGRSYSFNNMRVALHILREHLLMPLWRFDATSSIAFRDECDELIDWIGGGGGGLLAEYFNGTNLAGAVVGSETVQTINEDFGFNPRFPVANPEQFSVRYSGRFKSPVSETITFIITSDDGVRLTVNGVILIDEWHAQGVTEMLGSIALVEDTEYTFTLEYRNDAAAGLVRAEYESPSIARQIIPMNRFYSVAPGQARKVERFTAHVAFPQSIDAQVAFESVMSRAPSVHWQDVGINGTLKIKFLVGTARPTVHTFYYNPNQTFVRSNIAFNSFSTYPRPAEQRPSFFFIGYRDSDDLDNLLPQKYLPFDRPELRQSLGGFSVDLGIVPMGVMNQSLADRIGESNMRLNSDLSRFVLVRGQRDAHHVAKGDFVEVVHDIPQWTLPRLFMVIEESFARGAAGERDFLLQEISTQFYSDTAHGRIQGSTGGDIVPPFSPPPPVIDVDLDQGTRILGDGTIIPTIDGTVTAAFHPYAQRLRVWWKSPVDSDWRLTDKSLTPDLSTFQAAFQLEATQSGLHQIKIVSESQAGGLKLPFDQHPIFGITISILVPAVPTPQAVSGFTGFPQAQRILWNWNDVPVGDKPLHSHFEIFTDAALTLHAAGGEHVNATFYLENFSGTGAVDRWIVAVNKAGKRSAAAHAAVNVVAVPDVNAFAGNWNGTEIIFSWNEVADTQQRILGYVLYDNSNQQIGFVTKPPFRYVPTSPTSTIRIKALDRAGNLSASYSSATVVIAPPAPPASVAISYDGFNLVDVWPASVSLGVVAYDVRDGANALLRADVVERKNIEPPIYGTQNYTRRVYAVDRFGQRSTTYAEQAFSIPRPSVPTDPATTGMSGEFIAWRWNDVPESGAFVVRTTAGATLATLDALEWKERPTFGTRDYTRRIFAVNNAGIESATYLEIAFSVPRPGDVSAYSFFFIDAVTFRHSWNFIEGNLYEIATANNGTGVLARGKFGKFDEVNFSTAGGRAQTRYIRAIDENGISSLNYTSFTLNVAAPAKPTITKDATNARPNAVVVYVATATPQNQIQTTVIEMRASGGAWPASTVQGTPNVIRIPGFVPSFVWEYAAGGSAEVRVTHEDAFGAGTTSDPLAHSFSQWIGSSIAPNVIDSSHLIVGSIGKSLVPDGSFEAASPVWADYNNAAGPTRNQFSIITLTDAPDGDKVARIAASAAGGLTSRAFPVRPLKTYSFRLSVRSSNGNGTNFIQLYFKANQADYIYLSTQESSASITSGAANSLYTSWTLLQGTFTVPAGMYWCSFTVVTVSTGTFDVDDIEIFELAESVDIAIASINDAHINNVRANKILANLLDAFIILADKIGSRNFVSAGSIIQQTEAGEWDSGTTGGSVANQLFTKTAANGFGNAGASLNRTLFYGDGKARVPRYAIANLTNGAIAGFTWANEARSNNFNTIDFGVFLNYLGAAQVYENGSAIAGATFTWNAGETVDIEIASGVLKYYKVATDGVTRTLIYTSLQTPRYPLRFDAAIDASGNSVSAPALTGVLSPLSGTKPHAQNVANVIQDLSDDFTGNTASAWPTPNAGFSSAGSEMIIPAGTDGGVESVIVETNKSRIFGFSFTDPDRNRDSVQYGVLLGSDGNLYAARAGVLTNYGAYALGGIPRIARENGSVIIRYNGASVHNFGAVAGDLILDTALENGATLKSLRVYKAGAIAQGWQGDPSGVMELGKGARVAGKDFYLKQINLISAIADNNRYRGNDSWTYVLSRISQMFVVGWNYVDRDSDRIAVQISINNPTFQSDTYANTDSSRLCQCRVLNQFGEEIAVFKPFPFLGDGVCAEGLHSIKYADPDAQAIYALKFLNTYGWSDEIFLKAGAISITQPAAIRRTDAPQEVVAVRRPEVSGWYAAAIGLSWGYAYNDTSQGDSFNIDSRRVGESVWRRELTNPFGSNEIAFGNAEAMPLDEEFEFRVIDSSRSNTQGNIVRAMCPSNYALTDPPAVNVRARVNRTNGSVDIVFSFKGASILHGYVYRYEWNSGLAPVLVGDTLTGSINDAGATRGKTYLYTVKIVTAGNVTTPAAKSARVAIPPSMNPADPTSLSLVGKTDTTASLKWNLNSAVGAVTFDYREDVSPVPAWTSVSLAAGTSQTTQTLTANKNYIARVRVADAGTSPSNEVRFSLIKPKGYEDTPVYYVTG